MIRRIAADIVINQRETDEESPVCGDPPSVTLKVVLIEPSSYFNVSVCVPGLRVSRYLACKVRMVFSRGNIKVFC